jgi:hypothetical protein
MKDTIQAKRGRENSRFNGRETEKNPTRDASSGYRRFGSLNFMSIILKDIKNNIYVSTLLHTSFNVCAFIFLNPHIIIKETLSIIAIFMLIIVVIMIPLNNSLRRSKILILKRPIEYFTVVSYTKIIYAITTV